MSRGDSERIDPAQPPTHYSWAALHYYIRIHLGNMRLADRDDSILTQTGDNAVCVNIVVATL